MIEYIKAIYNAAVGENHEAALLAVWAAAVADTKAMFEAAKAAVVEVEHEVVELVSGDEPGEVLMLGEYEQESPDEAPEAAAEPAVAREPEVAVEPAVADEPPSATPEATEG